MSNPTTPFGWQMPTSTDLVTDLPADFEVFGQAVATSMGDLLGGTTGQILSKATNTDMDFTWTTPNPGDITGVTAGVGISGGGTSGDVTVTNSMATAITTNGDLIYGTGSGIFSRLGIGSTGQGLSVVAGIPAWAASATSTLTTTGDLLYASAANTLARRGIGSTGNVLTVAGGVPTWAAPAGGGTTVKVASVTANTQVSSSSATFVDSGLTVSITPTSASSKILIMADPSMFANGTGLWTSGRFTRGGSSIYSCTRWVQSFTSQGAKYPMMYLDSPATTSATEYKFQFNLSSGSGSIVFANQAEAISSIIVLEIGA
jgi:hypothetical protein